jgi:hypothetical protein
MKVLFVLNLPIAMFKNLLISAIFVVSQAFGLLLSNGPEIINPAEGQIIQGKVEILGTIPEENFSSAELAYAYANTDTPAWFILVKDLKPASVAVLTTWDTNSISDGNYKLKLTVNYQDGSTAEVVVDNLLVRNYTPVEITPTASTSETEIVLTPATETPGAYAATSFPDNKAALSVPTVNRDLKIGLLLGLVFMVGLGIYSILRSWLRSR